MDEVIRDCLARHFAGESGRFRVVAPDDIPPLRASPERLEQAFLNLMRNAFEAGARAVEIRIRVWGGRLVVAVEDDGAGCAEENLANIGTPFFTARPGGGGTGLGCSVVASIFRPYGGSMRIYAKNALGVGGTGLIVIAAFPLAGGHIASPGNGEVVVAVESAGVRSCVLPPLINLGIQPILLSCHGFAGALPGGFRRPLLLVEEAWAGASFRHGRPVLPTWWMTGAS
jgi:hypothetical protein